jgi:glucose-6-phosphate 1-dehydrogenase
MVIFGAAGDLTKRKLIPALSNLAADRLLADRFALVGFARAGLNDGRFRDLASREIRDRLAGDLSPAAWDARVQSFHYVQGDFQDEASYVRLRDRLGGIDTERGTGGNYLFYLATPPAFFSEILRRLGQVGLLREEAGRWRRVIIEKPFGRDLDSARALNREILAVLDERQMYRIDHYLGKETVQNILVFRFSNGIFEPVWNRRYVDHVQITVAESLGVEQRGNYYDRAGALRDMIPNHLFQLLALTTMEPPNSFDADAVRDEKGKILKAIQPIPPDEVLSRAVRGQYDEGSIPGNGKVPAYRHEPHVSGESATETYVALRLGIDNWRWADVPFYLRTGKRLAGRVTEIAIQFRRVPFALFRDTPVDRLTPNRLVLRTQPEEHIALSFGAKIPGPALRIGGVDMDFCYEDYFDARPSTGYETLLYDCMNGDATLFQRADNVEAAWTVVTPILDVWGALAPRNFPNYAAGSWGPAEADQLLERDGRAWGNGDPAPRSGNRTKEVRR